MRSAQHTPTGRISIHVLREEDDCWTKRLQKFRTRFQSTSSARRTTQSYPAWSRTIPISIHVLREEDDFDDGIVPLIQLIISIHVLREEDDGVHLALVDDAVLISIHVLREEDDKSG